MKIELKYKCSDSWDRPVYEDEHGTLFVDTTPIKGKPMSLCTKYLNAVDGEPDTPVEYTDKYATAEFTVDHRMVWH